MKKRLIVSLAIALLLAATLSLPAVALVEQDVDASVTVGETISITLTDTGASGIQFGSVLPSDTETYGDLAQDSDTPAIEVIIGSETNVQVDIGIKGTAGTGTLAMDKWKYSTTFGGGKTSITTSYVKVYGPVGASSSSDIYHWIDVPASTASGTHTITVYYKAVATGGTF